MRDLKGIYFIFVIVDFFNHPANTGSPIVAVLTNAPAKISKGSNGYFSIIRF